MMIAELEQESTDVPMNTPQEYDRQITELREAIARRLVMAPGEPINVNMVINVDLDCKSDWFTPAQKACALREAMRFHKRVKRAPMGAVVHRQKAR